MGWLGSSKEATPSTPEASHDGGYIAPDRTARAQCWDGRDSFFRCLDRNGIVDSVKQDAKARELCAPELKEFERVCAGSWVTYFKKRRVMEYQRDQTLKRLEAENAGQIQPSSASGAAAAALRGSR